ncbi:PQQ-dependent sugar dehydrogenase [Qipengyuania marisflavi]|uniref:Sorbosone dehydrogenase family protein n=1 Tax=Qipengyuania marisflavi TaxID=2486356 RepID=A0A5S3PX58_9SPHN|nr:sorbosone dehydrogenase family protein [Qipengyuania marisflavi]TMM48185.1 sorbosone dehydrogenase family protein [Qipengyuania marisflavi]
MSTLKKLGIALLVLLLVLVVAGYFFTRGDQADVDFAEVTGVDPKLDEPAAESFPTVAIAEPIGWDADEVPVAAEGLAVTRFADGLDHPRTMHTLPNGDVLVSLTGSPGISTGESSWLRKQVEAFLFSKAGAGGKSPNQLVLLRDADGDGAAEVRKVLADNLDSPSGIAWGDGILYVANHDEVLAYPYTPGELTLTGTPKKIADLAHGTGHWMRNLKLSRDGAKLYAAVGSQSNIAEKGLEIEVGRALVWEIDIATGRQRIFASGLRNPNGLDFNPWSGELWTTVNERDMLGSDLVPDYLTNLPVGANYGWPWVYWKDNFDRRVKYDYPATINYVRKPEYALGPHVAALGLVFSREGATMGDRFASGAFIAEHGSWNRKPPSGYEVVYVPFDARGNPSGKPVPVLSGFLTGDGTTRGRPTWVEWAGDGALLVSDDTAGIIWRVAAPGAEGQAGITQIAGNRLPPQRELRGQNATFGKDDYARPAN